MDNKMAFVVFGDFMAIDFLDLEWDLIGFWEFLVSLMLFLQYRRVCVQKLYWEISIEIL
jgi:hypothetical protein